MSMLGGLGILLMLLVLSMCDAGSAAEDAKKKKPAKIPGPATKLTVPYGYDTAKGWEAADASPEYAVAQSSGLIGYLERAGDFQYRLRAVEAKTGKTKWAGEPWRPLTAAGSFPRVLSVTKGESQYFVAWSYGSTRAEGLNAAGKFISLDIYDTADGGRQRVEVPWAVAPVVTGTGPGILISDGKAKSSVVDPETGEIDSIPPDKLGYPGNCANCRTLTEVLAITDKGLLVSGAREFWVLGGWFSRNLAPRGAEVTSGLPTSVTSKHVLARWHHAAKTPKAATHEIWAVHDLATGKIVVQAECRRPTIAPSEYPQAKTSPDGRFLVAGSLAFDLEDKKGYCFEDPDGTNRLTLVSVTDEGTVFGAAGVRSAGDALAGAGAPLMVDMWTGEPELMDSNVRLPQAETLGVGLFRWTDAKNRRHLIAYHLKD
ncbi:hypothetical protein [Streptomyces solicathayae]|uniref:Lipoprotein n=1 Tax=Streptomyces solicathayae TaxID=3081768 RepID=A0ABZ0LZF5_9ACTN|nr:hypothetical protein [Streptomyces sp. HUAS YS2]WOX24695.1 hypothetical protein R2D22_26260 [Streptomyces sp. HUAS YS2]